MSNEPTTVQRVWIPLGVIIATVSFLFLFGMLLFKAGGSSSDALPTRVASSVPTDVASESANPSEQPSASSSSKHPDVVVLNGTEIAGLAKKAADQLHQEGWAVSSTGNWGADPLTESTIFYPQALKSEAQELAKLTGAKIKLADAVLATNALTYVVVK